jgi:tetratricopeptide (TPR) repeat protein
MFNHSAELSFRKGIDLADAGRYRDALGFFSGAIEIDKTTKYGRPIEPRYLSSYGLCLGLTRANVRKALECCRTAIRKEPHNPDFWWNLGQVALVVGKRGEAHKVLQRGLAVDPGHEGIHRDLKRMGVRRPPVLTFLARENPLNIVLGRARTR